MRIGVITPGFCASEDDWCIPALTDLARTLTETDELTVFALRYPHRRSSYSVHGARVYPSGGAQRAGLARLPILARTLTRILREARRRPFDLLWAWWAHEPGFVASLAGRLTGTPVVVSILGGELVDLADIDYGGGRSPVNRWLVARALKGAHHVTVGSKYLLRLAERRVPRDKLSLRPLGIDLERLSPLAAEKPGTPRLDGGFRLLQVASLIPVKDQGTLIDSFEIVSRRHPETRLHLVGEGEPEAGLAARIARLQGRVKFHGALDHGELAGVYRQADLLIQSSRFEAQGMAVLEAVACGCLAIGTAVGILPELFPDGAAEALTPPGAVEVLAEKISWLADPERRRKLAADQRAAVSSLELRASADGFRRTLERCISTARRKTTD